MRRNLNNNNIFYQFTSKERLMLSVKGAVIVLLFSYFFYRSLWAVFPLIPVYLVYQKHAAKELLCSKQNELRQQFKEVMTMLSNSLRAGYSAENAFMEAYEEMGRFYGKEGSIVKLLGFIKTGIENNVPLEKRIKEAGKKSKIAEITEFAGVFGAAKLSGGNMTEIMERTAAVIGDKIETEKEIGVMLSARKAEQKIMNAVPFFMLTYLDVTSPGFFSVLYHNLTGVVIMSGCLLVYVTAYMVSAKMVAIKV